MPEPNSLNTGKGRSFQQAAARLLGEHFGTTFRLDHPILIGDPPKDHRFDLLSADLKFVGECKNYSWTEGRNVPSAKMGFLNEAAYYLSFLPPATTRFLVLRKDTCGGRTETLADYYVRTNRHLLKGILVLEIDMVCGLVRQVAPERSPDAG